MDFLKSTAFSQSLEHIHLLLFILNIVYFLFLAYFGFLFGASAVSWYCNRKARLTGEQRYRTLSRIVVGIPLANKSLVLFLGVLPALAIVLISAQIFQATPVLSVSLMTISFLLLVAAAILLYAYKYTGALGGILDAVEPAGRKLKTQEIDLEEYRAATRRTGFQSARYGIAAATLAAFLFFASLAVMTNPLNWTSTDSILSLFILPDVYVRFLQFLTLSAAVTGIGMLYFLVGSKKKNEYDDDQLSLINHIGLTLAAAGMLLQPVLILLNLFLLPPVAVSGGLYFVSALAVVFMFLASLFVYAFVREGTGRMLSSAFFAVIVAVLFLVIRDQIAITNVTKDHVARLHAVYMQETESIKSKLGIALIKLTGEDIYNGRCNACHLFDAKKVGPPYFSVLPKYRDQKEKLISFILNPSKVDPAYPSMPNQGLKPVEADSIASFLLRRLEENSGKKQ
jgi:cytochrome c